MPLIKCSRCKTTDANVKRSKTLDSLCKECFFFCFETEIHETIVKSRLFRRGQKVAIGASGGKDSTVLAYILKTLNERHDYGLDLFLLSIDEGITGYRDDSLETVKQNRLDYQLPLKILSYQDLYGWTMDQIVQATGKRNNCTFCGVFRRQALDRGASLLGCDLIATGHNADDVAETVLMNILRGDISRLGRSTRIITETQTSTMDESGSINEDIGWCVPRIKPFKYTYEKEIVLYARFKRLKYFSTECLYSPNAYRGHVREFLKEMENICPTVILDIIHSGECLDSSRNHLIKTTDKPNEINSSSSKTNKCEQCGYISSRSICKACLLLKGLNSGRPKLGISKSSKIKQNHIFSNQNVQSSECQCHPTEKCDNMT